MLPVAILLPVTFSLLVPSIGQCSDFLLPPECRSQSIVECTIRARQFELWPQELAAFECLRIVRFTHHLLDMQALVRYNLHNSQLSVENHIRKIIDNHNVYYRYDYRFRAYKRNDMEPNDLQAYRPAVYSIPGEFQDCLTEHCHRSRNHRILECHNRLWTAVRFVFTSYVTIPCINRIVYLDFRGSILRNNTQEQSSTPPPFQFPNALALNLEYGSIDDHSTLAAIAPSLVTLRLPNDHYSLGFYMNVAQTLDRLAEIRTEWKTYWVFDQAAIPVRQFEVYEHNTHVIRTYDLNRSQFEIQSRFCRQPRDPRPVSGYETITTRKPTTAKRNKHWLWLGACWVFGLVAAAIALANIRRCCIIYRQSRLDRVPVFELAERQV